MNIYQFMDANPATTIIVVLLLLTGATRTLDIVTGAVVMLARTFKGK